MYRLICAASRALVDGPGLSAAHTLEPNPDGVHRRRHDLLARHVRMLAPPDRQLGESTTDDLSRHRKCKRGALGLEMRRAGESSEDVGERVVRVSRDLAVHGAHLGYARGLAEEHARGVGMGLHVAGPGVERLLDLLFQRA